MNELQNLWLTTYKNYLQAASQLGEFSTSDYIEAKEFADSVISSVNALKDPPCE